jgi:hypothetical protein
LLSFRCIEFEYSGCFVQVAEAKGTAIEARTKNHYLVIFLFARALPTVSDTQAKASKTTATKKSNKPASAKLVIMKAFKKPTKNPRNAVSVSNKNMGTSKKPVQETFKKN